jgi:ADP-glucose type glycogen/starch synthase
MIGSGSTDRGKPRILIVTPEITYLPEGMGNMANMMKAKAGGLADVSASLVAALFDLGADVHVTIPNYRRLFHIDVGKFLSEELRIYKSKFPDSRIHLAEDRAFYYCNEVYSSYHSDNSHIALAFQREVINNIIPRVNPQLIHCNDWMTGLIPAEARRLNIPCLFTVHNIHTQELYLEGIENNGIDAALFWPYLYYERLPGHYEEIRSSNRVDLLTSGIFAAHFINTVSPTFLEEIVDGRHDYIPPHIRNEIINKKTAGCATGILNAPDPAFDPKTDTAIEVRYSPASHADGKLQNKRVLQKRIGLDARDDAPLFFWPSRLDPVQKGCQLMTVILYDVVSRYWEESIEVVFVANGAYKKHFHDICRFHNLAGRVAVCDFDEGLSHLAYAASDFVLMPSLFEPCGLPQMIGTIYGSLPIVHDTGGLHDTITHLDTNRNTGNGFVFEVYGSAGLSWAVDQAMAFYRMPAAERAEQVARIMTESATTFNHSVTARNYFDIYEEMLNRPIVGMF